MDNTTNSLFNVSALAGWLFGLLFMAIGLINNFWGNDPILGISVLLLSLIYFPPANALLLKTTGLSIPPAAKIILGIFILWVTLGVGELSEKIDLMLTDL